MEMKKCTGKCGLEKPLSEFYFRKTTSNYDGRCKDCVKEYFRKYRITHKKEIRERRRKHYTNNRENIIKKQKEYSEDHKKEISDYQKIYRIEHKDELSEKKKIYYNNNKDNILAYQKKYRNDNKKILAIKKRVYINAKRKTDTKFNFLYIYRHMLRKIFDHKIGKIDERYLKYLGCSIEKASRHIEKQFTSDMSWENHGNNTWHIDHIIPLSWIRSEKDIERIKIVCNYKNLRPISAKENLKKGGSIPKNIKSIIRNIKNKRNK